MECLGYSYLDNPEELAQARAKIAAHRATARSAEQTSTPLGAVAGPSEFAAWRGHQVPVRSGSAHSSYGPVPGHDVVRETSQSGSDSTHLDVLDFPFLSPQSVSSNLGSHSHGHTQTWWGGGSSTAHGFDQAFTADNVVTTSSSQSAQVEFHQARHSGVYVAGNIENPNYSISPETNRSAEESYDHDSDSTDKSDQESITEIVCSPDFQVAPREGNDVLPFILQSCEYCVMTSWLGS